MVEPAELRPEELDRVEDALELLEVADTDDPSPAVRQRLGDFRKILQLSRSALPMLEVPHGLLDRVIAEARQAAEVPVLAPVVEHRPAAEPSSFWAKLRRFALVPGVALAGATALVLFMVQRAPESSVSGGAMREEIAQVDVQSKVVSEESRADDGVKARYAGEAEPPPAPGALAPAAEPAAVSPASPAPSLESATTAVPELAAEKKGKMDRGEIADLPDAKPTEDEDSEESPVVDPSGTPRWDIIARGDRARHKGDCDAARTEYKLALGDADARVRARAHAGIGLCSAADGASGAADSAYKAARELDPEISGFIETERPRGAGTGSSNAARAKAKKKAAPPPQQQQENADNASPRALDPMK
jgi:hypothetical protein